MSKEQSHMLDEVLEEIVRDGQNDVDNFTLNSYPSRIVEQNGAKAALSAMVREIIGEEPTWNRNMTHEESLEYQGQMSMYREQISAAKSLGFDMKVSTDG